MTVVEGANIYADKGFIREDWQEQISRQTPKSNFYGNQSKSVKAKKTRGKKVNW